MRRLTHCKQLGLAALLGAAAVLSPGYGAVAQDTPAEDASTAANPAAAPNVALVAAAPTAVPQTAVQPALDNPPQPGDAFPTNPWTSNE